MAETVSITLSVQEFFQMETLLGKLLGNADEREQDLILHIHKRLEHMRDTGLSDQATLDRLRQIAG